MAKQNLWSKKSFVKKFQSKNHVVQKNLGLRKLLNHKIRSLDVVGCTELTEVSLENLNKLCGDSLLELKLSGNWSQCEHLDTKIHVNNSILPNLC